MKQAFVVLLVVGSLGMSKVAGQNRPSTCTLTIRGTIGNVSASPAIGLLDSTGKSLYCDRGDGDRLCEAHVSCTIKEAVLTIRAPNFKKYRRNIAAIDFRSGTAVANVGEIQLRASELPVAVQVIRSTTPARGVRFQVVLHNTLKREVFVREATIHASSAGADVRCFIGGSAAFALDDTIQLSAAGGLVAATGSFQETTKGSGFKVSAAGVASVDLCGGATNLELRLPVAFTLPALEYSAVEFVLPPRFKISFVRSSRPLDQREVEQALSDPLGYDRFEFRFTTDRQEEMEIVAQHVGPAQGF